jgi:hypothetical protein
LNESVNLKAQGVEQLGGPPMGMHVDHGFLLSLSFSRLSRKFQSLRGRLPIIGAIYFKGHSEANVSLQRRRWAGLNCDLLYEFGFGWDWQSD